MDGAEQHGRIELLYGAALPVQVVETSIGAQPDVVAHMLYADVGLLVGIAGDGVGAHILPIVLEHGQPAVNHRHVDQAVVALAHVAGKAAIEAMLRQLPRLGPIDEHALPQRAYPHVATARAQQLLHGGADDNPILGLLGEAREGVGEAVVDVEPRRAAIPDVVVVLHERDDDVVLQRHLLVHHVAIHDVVHAVEAVQSVGGAQPQEAVAVAQATQHRIVGKAVGRRERAEGAFLLPLGRQGGGQEQE